MSLIINKKIRMLMSGYPTVSDKYNVGGGILAGSTAAKFGSLVKYSSTTGYFETAAGLSAVTDVAGIILATNVKTPQDFPATLIQVNPGEAFNLLINGYVGVELDDSASIVDIAAIAAVGAASTDTTVVAGKTYYTRASNSDGAGYLNDGTYKYTAVASPTGNPSTSSYYELSVRGSDAETNEALPGSKVYVILATGKITTSGNASSGTVVELPGYVFTGITETIGGKKFAEVLVK